MAVCIDLRLRPFLIGGGSGKKKCGKFPEYNKKSLLVVSYRALFEPKSGTGNFPVCQKSSPGQNLGKVKILAVPPAYLSMAGYAVPVAFPP